MSIGRGKRWRIFERDLFTCRYCGRRSPDVVLEVDHYVARSRGGDDSDDNLVTACEECNRGKTNREIDLHVVTATKWRGERERSAQMLCYLLYEIIGGDALEKMTAHQLVAIISHYEPSALRRAALAVRDLGIADAAERWNRFVSLCNAHEATA